MYISTVATTYGDLVTNEKSITEGCLLSNNVDTGSSITMLIMH